MFVYVVLGLGVFELGSHYEAQACFTSRFPSPSPQGWDYRHRPPIPQNTFICYFLTRECFAKRRETYLPLLWKGRGGMWDSHLERVGGNQSQELSNHLWKSLELKMINLKSSETFLGTLSPHSHSWLASPQPSSKLHRTQLLQEHLGNIKDNTEVAYLSPNFCFLPPHPSHPPQLLTWPFPLLSSSEIGVIHQDSKLASNNLRHYPWP